MTPRSLVTGATGQVGGAAVRALLQDGAEVAALVREPARAATLKSAELKPGSFDDEDGLSGAMTGVDVLLLAGPDGPDHVAQHERVLVAAERAEVAHVVLLSAVGASADAPIALLRDHAAVERRLRDGSARWTILRPHFFMQNLLRDASAIAAHGELVAPMGAARVPLVDTDDVGAAAAAVLRDPGPHAGQTYILTGPARVSYDAVAAALSRTLGRRVRYQAMTPERYEQRLLASGTPRWRARDLAYIPTVFDDRDLATTPDLQALLGRRSRSLDDFLAARRDDFARGGAV